MGKELFAGYRPKVENLHVWELTEGEYVCSLKVIMNGDANDKAV